MVAQDVKQSIEITNMQLMQILQHITASLSHTTFYPTQHSVIGAPVQRQPAPAAAPSPILPSSLQPQGQSSMPVTRSLTLGDGQQLVFTADDVPVPPAVSFARDIATLNMMWDDTSEHWKNDSKMRIKGIPIAIVYWNDIYTSKPNINWKPKQWKGIKGKWFNWKVIVRRYRESSPDQFWATFSENGQHLGYKAILGRLSLERKEKN
ncbi:hypothetical protein CPB84DRAFT_1740413 [Gymnopilus junonius]|uniref:Uncharacterized protein n=1 Tax=Gymnopilus junonius TaxID=109634 RepID=A0A9P5N748_GYMJU|nr:hypothetical protein CPB84DRAFT_1740413 [Gymnopilus junonius]